jgi:hypothetical protein
VNGPKYPRVLHFASLKRLALDKYFCLLCPFKSYKENKVLSIWLQEKGKKEKTQVQYSQCFIFFVTYEWAQYPRVLHYTGLKRLTLGLHFSLLCPFKSYKENKVLLIWLQEKGKKEKTQVPYSHCFTFSVTSEWAQYPRVLHFASLKRLALDKDFCLLCPFKSYKETKVLLIWLQKKGKKEKTQVPYSQCFLFSVTCEWAQYPRVLHYTGLKRLAFDKHFSILCPFKSYKENIVLSIWLQESYSKHFIFFEAYELAKLDIVFVLASLSSLVKCKHSSLLGSFVSYEENEEV